VLLWGQPTDIAAIPAATQFVTRQLEIARAAVKCDGVCVYWFNDATEMLIPLALSENLLELQPPVIHPGQGMIGTSFLSQQPVSIDRAYHESTLAHPFAIKLAVQSAFAIPLTLADRSVGVMWGATREPRELSLQDRTTLAEIAGEITKAFDELGAVLVEAQISRAEYALVSSLIRDYATDADFDHTCGRIASVALTLLGCDYAVIARQEPDLSYSYHGTRATRSKTWSRAVRSTAHRTIEADDMLDAGETVIVGAETIGDTEAGFHHSRDEGARIVMLAPIAINRHRIGILICGWRTEVTIARRLRHLAQTLAGHAAIAIAESQRTSVFTGAAIEARRTDDSIARRLNEALARGDIFLEYQPIFDARTGKVVSFEALSRWPGAPEGYERPDQFILFAEDRGIIGALTDYVIDLAAREWPRFARLGATLIVNVSMRNFEEPGFAKRTLAKLAQHKIPTDRFGIELTETSRMVDRPNAVETARKLGRGGVTLSIDDFGEGYAALSYLKTFRASSLKIDKRYVTNVATDAFDLSIVRSVTELAHSLGVSVVAEGIETVEALEIIKSLGCDMVQGYVCARPMPIEQLDTYLP
jgi:EAL domain-containing protein (putative c-di-GMP-specific phosphodiesterase class I)